MVTFPNAKINLGLFVKGKRSDGFHDIESIMIPLCYHDILEILPSERSKTTMKISGLPIPGNPTDNLVFRAWSLLHQLAGIPHVDIHLHKKIPFQAGLGGGSADAAFALLMLSQLFELEYDHKQLKDVALQLGSDCPFFLENNPQLVFGRGERLRPAQVDLHDYHIVVIKPPASVGTAEAYRNIEFRIRDGSLEEYVRLPMKEWKEHIENDFEEYAFKKHPVIFEIKKKLYALGAEFALMSGSGSAVFGIFNKATQIEKHFPGSVFWEGKTFLKS